MFNPECVDKLLFICFLDNGVKKYRLAEIKIENSVSYILHTQEDNYLNLKRYIEKNYNRKNKIVEQSIIGKSLDSEVMKEFLEECGIIQQTVCPRK